LATFRNLPSMNILRRPQSLILVKENNVDRYTKLAVNAKEYNQVVKKYYQVMPSGRQIPECTQKHHWTTMREELFLTLYNATLLKLHLTSCFTLIRSQQISSALVNAYCTFLGNLIVFFSTNKKSSRFTKISFTFLNRFALKKSDIVFRGKWSTSKLKYGESYDSRWKSPRSSHITFSRKSIYKKPIKKKYKNFLYGEMWLREMLYEKIWYGEMWLGEIWYGEMWYSDPRGPFPRVPFPREPFPRIKFPRGPFPRIHISLTRGNVTRGNVTRRNLIKGNVIRGNVIRGNVIRGNVIRGNVTRGNVFSGKCVFGEMVYGEMVHGEM
jgi:hypothetical protein